MSFNVKCPHCGTILEAENRLIGIEVECPSCKRKFVLRREGKGAVPPKAPDCKRGKASNAKQGKFMKSICPHCKQEFFDIPETYLYQTLECPTCKKKFVCKKPKFCPDCGTVNSENALVCRQCGKQLALPMPDSVTSSPQYRSTSHYNESFYDCYVDDVGLFTAWKKIGDFTGRSNRKEYFLYNSSIIILAVALHFASGFLSPTARMAISWSLGIVLLLVSIPLYVRRMHDLGNSGWWLLLLLLVPPIILTAFFVYPSEPGENKWGPNPAGVPSSTHYGVGRRIFCLLETLLLLIGLPLLFGAAYNTMIAPAIEQADEYNRRTQCTKNLKTIGDAIKVYASDHGGRFPPDLHTLRHRNYLRDDAICRCPSSSRSEGYIYLGKGVAEGDESALPLLIDFPDNHVIDNSDRQERFVHILYKGGHVIGHKLKNFNNTSCVDILRELHPQLENSEGGGYIARGRRLVLENARRADGGGGSPEAAENDDPAAMYNRGVCYYRGQGVEQNYGEAVKWFEKAAEHGLPAAMYNLGVCYLNGHGVEQNYGEAVKWFTMAAEKGDSLAPNNLGFCYEHGFGVEQNHSVAAAWYRVAAEKGHPQAMLNLGVCYVTGRGVEQNHEEAVKWFFQAAEKDNAQAMYNLGVSYEYGYGVNRDYSEAFKWYRQAAARGHQKARERLNRREFRR